MAKDWKGNSRAAQYSLAAKKADSNSVREQDDFYATDPEALEKLLQSCSYWLHNQLCRTKSAEIGKLYDHIPGYIWECACGNGNLVDVLNKNGFKVIASDLKDRGYGMTGIDFLHTTESYGNIILTNPPYSLANEFILHALDILPYAGLYIALMNVNTLAGIERYKKIFSTGVLREVYVFSKRIGCWKNNVRDDQKAHIINYAWFVFQKGFQGQPTLYWL